ncbi:MAG TPA: PAS domain-containing protein, partial [Actinomycetota bacterium]|nr:PAS domain-containing protein [Actinomycetota bacterium]
MTEEEVERLRSQVHALEQLLEVHERTALDQALRLEKTGDRMFEFFRQAPAIIGIITGHELVLEFANDGFLNMLAARSDFVGKPLPEAFPELHGQGYFEIARGVLETGEPFLAHEAPVNIDLDGSGVLEQRFFDFVYQPVRDADDTVVSIFVHAVDVTHLVRARQEVESLASSLRGLADASL